ncbi:unnamed protein product [Ranitomeya imitator]|uniref:G-protein coupled receptors family 1 profile domain-containing protein n=1 Tax=Ranitomeya imitator TaxID=111125 RepID=A0ABN9LSW1_9NEOB|nr:unnamed protein product [Ranitomeya imitator]
MAFDRDLAINKPLHYSRIMNNAICIELAVVPWVIGFVITAIPTIVTAELEFCGPNEINHYFCDFAPIQNLACSNPTVSNLVTSSAAAVGSTVPFMIILGFYIHIIVLITKIKSTRGKKKAFSTCSSHLTVASLFYGSTTIVYVRPKGSQHDKFLALIYTVIIPFLNPFIYTLKNKDVKAALKNTRLAQGRLLNGSRYQSTRKGKGQGRDGGKENEEGEAERVTGTDKTDREWKDKPEDRMETRDHGSAGDDGGRTRQRIWNTGKKRRYRRT